LQLAAPARDQIERQVRIQMRAAQVARDLR
jgi:hypothetical protein